MTWLRVVFSFVLAVLLIDGCAHTRSATAMTRDKAIAIAKAQVQFQPFDITAVRTAAHQREIWRVVLKGRLPGEPPLLFETTVVEIDAATGAILSIAKT